MASDLNGECKVNITRAKRSSGDESRNKEMTVREARINGVKSFIVDSAEKIWKLGKEDPRRVIHSAKVGLSLTVVSLFYLMDPLFSGVGDSAIWAVMTVVVVLEFTAGATFIKGLNRALGTLLAGFLATSLSYLSEQVGQPEEAIFIGFIVFFFGAAATFSRFVPTIRRRYDYGVLIFILTFNLIIVSSYRVDNVLRMACQRLSTIALGCGVCLVISLVIYPIWAGEDLHNATVHKFEVLAESLEKCVYDYFDEPNDETDEDEAHISAIFEEYKCVLDSKTNEESLATFASWEPRHGRFRHRHPWKQYVNMGAKIRHLAYSVVALHECLKSEIQTPYASRSVLKNQCIKVGEEAAELLRVLSYSIKEMTKFNTESRMEHLQLAVKDLNAAFNAQPRLFMDSRKWLIENSVPNNGGEMEEPVKDQAINQEMGSNMADKKDEAKGVIRLSLFREEKDGKAQFAHKKTFGSFCKHRHGSVEYGEALPLATFAWLLVETVARLEHVVRSVDELATMARFTPCKTLVRVDSPPLLTPKKSKVRISESHTATQCAE